MSVEHGEMAVGSDVADGVDVGDGGVSEGEFVDGDLGGGREPGGGQPLRVTDAAGGVDVEVDGHVLAAVVEADDRLVAGLPGGFDAGVVDRGDAHVGEVVFGAFAYFGTAFAGQACEELGGAAEDGDFLVRVCSRDFACIK